eukprot:Skav236630  [mRNA]  locus=scaffold2276:97248:97773:- [translate_table: standard]
MDSLKDTLEGFTPLHWAVLSDNPKAVIWLLNHQADKEIKDIQGRTAEDLIEDGARQTHLSAAEEVWAQPETVEMRSPEFPRQSRDTTGFDQDN